MQRQNMCCNISPNDLVSLGAYFWVDYTVDKKIPTHRQHLYFIVTLNYLSNFRFSCIASWTGISVQSALACHAWFSLIYACFFFSVIEAFLTFRLKLLVQ